MIVFQDKSCVLCLEIFFEDFKPSQKLEAGNSKLFHEISLVKPQGEKGNHKFPAVAGFLCDKSVVKSAALINTIIGALQLFYKNMFYIFVLPFALYLTFRIMDKAGPWL
jgi:hypothetical protein